MATVAHRCGGHLLASSGRALRTPTHRPRHCRCL